MKSAIWMLAVVLLGVMSVAAVAEEAEEAPQATVEQSESQAPAVQGFGEQWLEAQVTVTLDAIFAGEVCGGAICGKFEYCCNPTCSLCVPFGWSCTQEVCN